DAGHGAQQESTTNRQPNRQRLWRRRVCAWPNERATPNANLSRRCVAPPVPDRRHHSRRIATSSTTNRQLHAGGVSPGLPRRRRASTTVPATYTRSAPSAPFLLSPLATARRHEARPTEEASDEDHPRFAEWAAHRGEGARQGGRRARGGPDAELD